MSPLSPRLCPSDSAPVSDLPLLDDAAAGRSAGSLAQLALLRRLLLGELRREAPRLMGAVDSSDAASILHRWTSACGFCGALRLRDRVERWRWGLRMAGAGSRPPDFERVVAATCSAIASRSKERSSDDRSRRQLDRACDPPAPAGHSAT